MTNKYTNLQKDFHSIFSASEWTAENIKTFPTNFIGTVPSKEYIRVSILPSGEGIDIRSVSGQAMIDIFVPAGAGPLRASQIADRLDNYLVGRSLKLSSGHTQFHNSTLSDFGIDKANPSLFRSIYSIPFNHFGV